MYWGAFEYDLTTREGGSNILEKCEDHCIKRHKKNEDGGGLKIIKKGVRSYLNGPLSGFAVPCKKL